MSSPMSSFDKIKSLYDCIKPEEYKHYECANLKKISKLYAVKCYDVFNKTYAEIINQMLNDERLSQDNGLKSFIHFMILAFTENAIYNIDNNQDPTCVVSYPQTTNKHKIHILEDIHLPHMEDKITNAFNTFKQHIITT